MGTSKSTGDDETVGSDNNDNDNEEDSMKIPEIPIKVLRVFSSYQTDHQTILLKIRQLIFETASTDKCIGPLTETLKWGEPAYLTEETKSGSTLRLGISKDSQGPAVFVSCNTALIQNFKQLGSDSLSFIPPREISFPEWKDDVCEALRRCIYMTLTYHLNKKSKVTPAKRKAMK